MAQFDAKSVHKNDWGVIGGGAVVLVASFLTWFSVDVASIISVNRNGWNSGFFSWFGVLCAIVAAGIVVARILGVDLPKLAVGWRTVVLALVAVSAIFIVLKLLTGFHSWDRGIGLYLAVVGAIVQVVFAYLAFAASGERADIDRMRAERAAKAAATPVAPPPPAAPGGYTAPPPPVFAPPPVVDAPVTEAAVEHDHDHDDHEGHDHPHA